MNARRVGVALRLIGPLLEIVCIGLLLSNFGRERPLIGRTVEALLYLGVAIGLAMVAIGLGLSATRPGGPARPRGR